MLKILLKQLKIKGIISGRNSYDAVYKSGLTKIINGNASRMSISVFKKRVISGTISGIPGSISSGVKSYFDDIDIRSNKNLKYCTIEW